MTAFFPIFQAMTESPVSCNHTQNIVTLGVTVSSTNSSEPWKEPSFTAAAKLRVVLTFCFFLFAGYSNSAVLYSVARKGRKSHIRILILSLTIADLMITFIVMPLDTIWNITVQWYAGEVPCKVLNFLKLFAMYSSALVLVVISLDRHTAILRPFSFTGASHRNRVMLAVAWTASILLASPQLFLFQLRTVEGVNFTQCIASGSFNERWKETLYNMFTFVTLYVTPLSVMIFCYARILWEIGRQANHGKECSSALTRSKNDHISKARLKTLKMTIVIVASFIVCWTPYYLLGLWYWFQPNMIEEMPEYIHHSLFLFGLLHTCSDPIIYGLYTPCFREDMRMCCHGVTRHKLAQKPRTVALLHVNGDNMGSVVSNRTAVQTVF
ncbi:vasopressin V1b receptor-like [Acipenser oxyrinchus oxyrinchus]|uniref:Type II GnRH receptor n=1 Tax=Acipenser oxyrinchus oxyrinchus TaxID=40147 RepID=A0AAD8D1Q3_ACIOX|nr:vasopressin V1b receptor-like [Acipenser oxyrinchus oxyrinchus]